MPNASPQRRLVLIPACHTKHDEIRPVLRFAYLATITRCQCRPATTIPPGKAASSILLPASLAA